MFRIRRWSLFTLAALLLFVSTAAFSQQVAPTGTWRGVYKSGDKLVRVDVTVDANQASMHFGETFNCLVNASFIQTEDGSSTYAVKAPTNGGAFCQKLHPGYLVIKASGEDASASFNKNGKTEWTILLTH